MSHSNSRRLFLQRASAMLGAATLAPSALAQTSGDYKALVCIFLLGGNDGHNTIVPMGASEFAAYRAGRGNLALPDGQATLLGVTTKGGAAYGLNSGLAAIHPMWASGKLAFVANVGLLAEPVTRQGMLSGNAKLPSNLYSHMDQVAQMQTGDVSGPAPTGWAGRSADVVQSMNGSSRFPSSISMNGAALFGTGQQVQGMSMQPGYELGADGFSGTDVVRINALNKIIALESGVTLVQAANQVRRDSVSFGKLMSGSSSGGFAAQFPWTSIGQQLQQVARVIKMRASAGMARQVFFCSVGSFDTHYNQGWAQCDLLRQVSEAMSAFYAATNEMGVADQVTSFTESEFGRTLQPSGSGSDHGWGNHHWVMGGAVKGGELYGKFPSLLLGGNDDTGNRGSLIPTTSLDQYAATLANWFGVKSSVLNSVFPNLKKFNGTNLGFMR